MKKYVIGFLFNLENQVALIRKNRPEWQKGKLNGIGGHIENGEQPVKAMIREFQEEAGANVSWDFYCSMIFDEAIVYCFRSVDNVRIKTMTDEEVGWYDCSSLPLDVIPNLNWLIPMALLVEPYMRRVEMELNETNRPA